LIAAAMLGLSLTGPGSWSLDSLWRVRLPEPATWLVFAVLTLLGVAGAIAMRAMRTEDMQRHPPACEPNLSLPHQNSPHASARSLNAIRMVPKRS
jgi:hypothetical protein